MWRRLNSGKKLRNNIGCSNRQSMRCKSQAVESQATPRIQYSPAFQVFQKQFTAPIVKSVVKIGVAAPQPFGGDAAIGLAVLANNRVRMLSGMIHGVALKYSRRSHTFFSTR